ncbi:MAG TPA: hypothetical protein VK524_22410, partial [Polyangiaceae bacterium]|nr:hypothetical protein [Polyangiaceae bacterium]
MTTGPKSKKRGLLRSYESTIGVVQRLADAGWIVLGQYIACVAYPSDWSTINTLAAAIAVIVFHLIAEVNGLYRPWRGSPMRNEIFQVLTTWALVVPVLLFIAFATKSSGTYSRVITITWFSIAPNLIVLWRVAVRLVLQEVRRRGRNSRNVAIAGATPIAHKLAQRLMDDESAGMRLLGYYDDRSASRRHEPLPEHGSVVGNLDTLIEHAREGRFDVIYITFPLKAEPRINTIVRKLADTTASVYVVADFFVFDLLHAKWSNVGDIPVVS